MAAKNTKAQFREAGREFALAFQNQQMFQQRLHSILRQKGVPEHCIAGKSIETIAQQAGIPEAQIQPGLSHQAIERHANAAQASAFIDRDAPAAAVASGAELSKPMTKKEIAGKLGITVKTLNKMSRVYRLHKQLHTRYAVELNHLDPATRRRIEAE
jgi:hypothetical protein